MQLNYLRLYLGVPSPLTYGASGQYDPVPESIDFLDSMAVFQLDSNGGVPAYEYAIAGLKNGGVRGDSPIVDSSVILAAPYGTVTETITLVSAAAASSQNATLSKIERFGRYANGLNANTYQSMPVYIERWCVGEPAPTYALVLDMSFSVIGDNELGGIARLTVSWEREPFWRAIPPGANPKLYAFQQRELANGTDFDYTDLDLILWNEAAAVQNWLEQTVANAATFSAASSQVQNFIDIPAEDIPGDAPALTCIVMNATSSFVTNGNWIARNTKPFVDTATPEEARMSHNGGDATIASPAGVTTSYVSTAAGIRCDPPGASVEGNYVAQIVYAAGAITAGAVCTWNRVLLKNYGRYAVLLRGRRTAGTTTNMQLTVRLSIGTSLVNTVLDETVAVNPTDVTAMSLTYMGNFDLTDVGLQVGYLGLGADSDAEYILELRSVARGAAVAVTWQLADLILIPYDEFATYAVGYGLSGGASLDTGQAVVFDKTGYFTRAKPPRNAQAFNTTASPPFIPTMPTTGQMIELEPGVDNRLYFLFGTTAEAGDSLLAEGIGVRINIVPRWRHLRDRL